MIAEYYVGAKPSEPILADLRDDDGLPLNMTKYVIVRPILKDRNNDEVDMDGALVGPPNAAGQFYLNFPSDRSVFETPGEYVLHLELVTLDGYVDYTDALTIRVKEIGGK